MSDLLDRVGEGILTMMCVGSIANNPLAVMVLPEYCKQSFGCDGIAGSNVCCKKLQVKIFYTIGKHKIYKLQHPIIHNIMYILLQLHSTHTCSCTTQIQVGYYARYVQKTFDHADTRCGSCTQLNKLLSVLKAKSMDHAN